MYFLNFKQIWIIRYVILIVFLVISKYRGNTQSDSGLTNFFSASGKSEKEKSLEKWFDKLLTEFPEVNLTSVGTVQFMTKEMSNLLFTDKTFSTVYGVPVDKLSFKDRDIITDFSLKIYPVEFSDKQNTRTKFEQIKHFLLEFLVPDRIKGKDRHFYSNRHQIIIKNNLPYRSFRVKYDEMIANIQNTAKPVEYGMLEEYAKIAYAINLEVWPSEKKYLLELIQQKQNLIKKIRVPVLLTAYNQLYKKEIESNNTQPLDDFLKEVNAKEPYMLSELPLDELNRHRMEIKMNPIARELDSLGKSGITLVDLNQWYNHFTSKHASAIYLNSKEKAPSVYNITKKYYDLQIPLLQKNEASILKAIAEAGSHKELTEVIKKYFGGSSLFHSDPYDFKRKNDTYKVFQKMISAQEEEIKPVVGRFSKIQLARIDKQSTPTGEPTEEQMEAAFALKIQFKLDKSVIEGYFEDYPDYKNNYGKEAVSGFILFLGFYDKKLGDIEKIDINKFVKLNCTKADDDTGVFRCEYILNLSYQNLLLPDAFIRLFNPDTEHKGASRFYRMPKLGWIIVPDE